jgi:hypothetical protein
MSTNMDYWKGKNQGDYYLCDRCNVSKLSEYEYEGNYNPDNNNRYCTECANYIIIRKWKCNTCESSGTMRHERILPKVCCEENVIWLK